MTPQSRRILGVSLLVSVLLIAVAVPLWAQADNIWIGAGAGLWIEFSWPLSWIFDDIHYTAVAASSHFHSQILWDITKWIQDNLGIDIAIHLEANAGVEVPGVGEVNVGKAGGWVNGKPPFNNVAAHDFNADGNIDIPLWELPGKEADAMVVSNYDWNTATVNLYIVTPAPRIDESNMEKLEIPMPGDLGYEFEDLGTYKTQTLVDLVVPGSNRGDVFLVIPADALYRGSPELHEIASVTIDSKPQDNGEPLGEPVDDFNRGR